MPDVETGRLSRFLTWLTAEEDRLEFPDTERGRRARGAYLGLAVGDALGATLEFMTPNEIRHRYGRLEEIVGGGWLHLTAGQVTDDTEMALALGASILEHGSVRSEQVAALFVRWMKSGPVDIGGTVSSGLRYYERTGDSLVPPDPYAAGNGAVMRILPVALHTYGAPEADVVAACQAQAHVTHNNVLSDAACLTVVQMLHAALDGAPLLELLHRHAHPLAARHEEFRFRGAWEGNPSGYIVHTLRAVFQSLFSTESFEDCVVDVVNRGGDADTTGAIAGMLAGAVYGVEAIPRRWVRTLARPLRRKLESQALALLASSQKGL